MGRTYCRPFPLDGSDESLTVAPDGSDDLLNDDDYDRDNCDDDNDDGYDNAADDANFFALEISKWSATRRTSYTIARNRAAVPPKIDLAPSRGSTCFPPHGES